MLDAVKDFLDLLKVEKIGENLFRGRNHDTWWGRVYGGHILAQSLSAASQTVAPDRSAHSIHTYFLNAGDLSLPITYRVESLREGRSITARTVTASQNEKPICAMNVSFHINEDGFEHQSTMPDITSPEKAPSVLDYFREAGDILSESIRGQLTLNQPIDFRVIGAVSPSAPEKMAPTTFVWFKVNDALPDDMSVHKCILLYASDYAVIPASLNPHGHSLFDSTIQAMSIDHILWFHRDFRADEWLLNSIESPSASKARVLNRGSIYTRDGKLVASFAQEGLIRRLVR
jgi:acyl-CoA thioesterase II